MGSDGEPTRAIAGPPLGRQARKAETRRALIQAAAELFGGQGIERTSLDEIAARVGLTIGAIYANFRNKEELIDAVIGAYSQVSEGPSLFDASLGIAERWAALGHEVTALMPQIAPDTLMLLLEFDLYILRHPAKAQERRQLQHDLLAEDGAKLEALAQARSEQLPMRGAELIALLDGITEGIGFAWMREPDLISPDAIMQLFALLGRGLEAWADERAEG